MIQRKRQCLRLAAILAGIYAIYVTIMASQQDRIVFAGQGIPMSVDLREDNTLAFYTKLKTSFGYVHACYLESEREFDDCPIVMVAHGNAETIGHWAEVGGALNELGLSVFLVEYPGYGGSDGKTSKETISETMDQGYAWLESRGRPRRKVIGLGHGFGSGPILDLARRKPLDGLVLSAPYTSTGALTRELGLPSILLKTHYDNLEALAQFTGPTLLFHGKQDRLISPKHSRRLAQVDEGRIILEALEAAHKDLWTEPDSLMPTLKNWMIEQGLRS